MWVPRKGARDQILLVDAKTSRRWTAYLRARRGHRCTALADLWLGAHGDDTGLSRATLRMKGDGVIVFGIAVYRDGKISRHAGGDEGGRGTGRGLPADPCRTSSANALPEGDYHMDKGDATAAITIVPDCGTGGLQGISRFLDIDNDEGAHSRVLEYEIR